MRRPASGEKFKWLSLHITNCRKPKRTYLSGRILYRPDVRYQLVQITEVESKNHEEMLGKIFKEAL